MSMQERPLVSILTPSYNQAAWLPDNLRSVACQTYPRIEHVVMDGGSTDGSVDIIRRHAARLAWWVSEADAGQTAAINKGFGRARGEVLAWLNSDDLLRPGAVRQAVAELTAHPAIGMVYGDVDYVDAEGKVAGRFPAAQTDAARLRRGFVHIPQQAAFFRARLWRMVGPLDPSFYFAMDYDLWVRIAAVARLRYVPRTWAAFRLHGETKTLAADDRCWPEMLREHRREGGTLLSPFGVKYLARRVLEPLMPLRLAWRLRRGPAR
jgi:glycosyltransferase involved in cell wall biosynthesis